MATSGIGVAVFILTKPNIRNDITVKEGRNDASPLTPQKMLGNQASM